MLKLEFLQEKCEKCGVIGDHRFIQAKCHRNVIQIHPGHLDNYHPNGLVWYHPNPSLKHITSRGTSIRHSGNKSWYHPKGMYTKTTTSYSSRPEPYHGCHWGTYAHSGSWVDGGGGRIAAAIFSFGISEAAKWEKWSCCGSRSDDPKDGSGCVYAYSCGSNHPCRTRNKRVPNYSSTEVYRCCDERGSGCKQKYSCCGNDSNSTGCVTQYNCCGSTSIYGCSYSCCDARSFSTTGCKQKYTCCQMPYGATGCKQKYSCCGNDPNSTGCTPACDLCEVKWGKGPGCSNTKFMDE